MASASEQAGLLSAPEWGNIKDVLNAPLSNVNWAESWFSTLLMWLTLPISLIQGIIGGLCQCAFVAFSIGNCCPCSTSCCSVLGSVLSGNPFHLAWTWWRYMIAALIALVANGKSRLALFMWEWEAFGKGKYWWHGEGVWMWSYQDCEKILKSQQTRKSAFGAVSACVPDLFASNILIFLSNTGGSDSEWSALRAALHTHFTNHETADYSTRINNLRGLVAQEWPNPEIADLNNVERLQRTVVKSIFYMMFNVWLEDAEATTLTGWRTNASIFILPRAIQRFIFNVGINRVKSLRTATVQLVEKYNLQDKFVQMNNSLPPKWRRQQVVKLCDEIMYVVGFAGIGGTCAAVESCASFMQCKIPAESAAEHIKWGECDTTEKMQTKFMIDPEKYIREVLRLDPPVTSATGVLQELTQVTLAGRDFSFNEGMYNQYVLSMANRDPEIFDEPEVFKPERVNLNRAFTWNGAFGGADEAQYPRICPGRFMSLDVTKVIIGHVVGISDLALSGKPTRGFGLC